MLVSIERVQSGLLNCVWCEKGGFALGSNRDRCVGRLVPNLALGFFAWLVDRSKDYWPLFDVVLCGFFLNLIGFFELALSKNIIRLLYILLRIHLHISPHLIKIIFSQRISRVRLGTEIADITVRISLKARILKSLQSRLRFLSKGSLIRIRTLQIQTLDGLHRQPPRYLIRFPLVESTPFNIGTGLKISEL